jgi:hypothetical protein
VDAWNALPAATVSAVSISGFKARLRFAAQPTN